MCLSSEAQSPMFEGEPHPLWGSASRTAWHGALPATHEAHCISVHHVGALRVPSTAMSSSALEPLLLSG
jgi:hypothetical protein